MITIWQDTVYGLRMLIKKPSFTAVAALSLALGIAANTIIFSLIDTTLLRPLTFRDPGRLLAIWTVPNQNPDRRNGVNVPSYLAWREQNRSFDSMGAFFGFSVNIGAEENGAPAERIDGQIADVPYVPGGASGNLSSGLARNEF